MHTNSIIYRKAGPEDYPGMLRLQSENYLSNLKGDDARDGFLSIEYTAEQFEEINKDLGISVAVRDGRIAGYLCATSFPYGARFPILSELMRALQDRTMGGIPINKQTTFIYGPVCIARSARGAGVLNGLFNVMRELARPRYEQCILFVSTANPRSFHAHTRKLAMHDLGIFGFNGKDFHMLGRTAGDEAGCAR